MDRTLDYALWLTLRELEPYWMPEFKAGRLDFGGDPKKIAFALSRCQRAKIPSSRYSRFSERQVAEGERPRHVAGADANRRAGRTRQSASTRERKKTPTDAQRNELIPAVEEAVRLRKIAAPEKRRINFRPHFDATGVAGNRPSGLVGLWKLEQLAPRVERIRDRDARTPPPADRAAVLEGILFCLAMPSQKTSS